MKISLLAASSTCEFLADLEKILPSNWELQQVPLPSGTTNDIPSLLQQTAEALHLAARKNEVLIIPDYWELDGEGVFGHSADLLKLIRLDPVLGGKKNKIRHSPVFLCSMVPLSSYLKRHPERSIVLSESVYFVDSMKVHPEELIEQLQFCKPLSQKGFEELPRYLSGMSVLPGGNTRHSAASVFSVHVMLDMAKAIYEESKRAGEEWAKIAKQYVLDYDRKAIEHISIRESWLKESLFIYGRKMQRFQKIEKELPCLLRLIKEIKDNIRDGQKIGLIDDEADQLHASQEAGLGWYQAFQAMLFDNEGIVEDYFGTKEEVPLPELGEEHLDDMVEKIGQANYACLLLDAHLNRNKEGDGIEHKLGTQLLVKLRKRFPTLPIIVITATNKSWKHRILIEKGADAVWVKEGIDERRSPARSYYNLYRILQLIARATGSKYQFLRRFGEAVERIRKDDGQLWWNKGTISWPHKGYQHEGYNLSTERFKTSAVNHLKLKGQIINLLEESLELLRSYLHATVIQFNEASGRRNQKRDWQLSDSERQTRSINFTAKALVIQLAKTVELIHGQKEIQTAHSDRINARVIGGGSFFKREKRKRETEVVRGDWIAFFLFQHRNECAHYFESVEYTFSGKPEEGRVLMNFISYLLAYLLCEKQPYYSTEKEELNYIFSQRNGYFVNPAYLVDSERGLLNRKKSEASIRVYSRHYEWMRQPR